jgi:hypothetical protein
MSTRMREFNDDGSLKNVAVLFHAAGFDVGQFVERRSDKTRGTIESFNSSCVKLLMDGTVDVLASINVEEFLNKKWSIIRKAVKDVLEVKPTKSPMQFDEFNVSRLAAFIQLELCNLTSTHSSLLSDLKVTVKPKREVCVSKSFDKNKLILVPTSLKIQCKQQDQSLSANSIVVDVVPAVAVKFLLTAPLSELEDRAHMAPFWFVGQSAEDEEINMHIVYQKSQLDGFKLKIPIARNMNHVAEGTRLCFKKQEGKRQADAAEAPAPKKARP